MRRFFACAALAFLLFGCQTTGGKGGAFCDIAKPIRLNAEAIAAMSDAQVDQALAHNRYGAKACGWKP